MHIALIFFLTTASLSAEIVVHTQEWQPACDGSIIEVTEDHGSIKSIRASATHNASVIEWVVHFLGGEPISAEYRESQRKKYSSGKHAGEPTGEVKLKLIKTWVPEKNGFQIDDKNLTRELRGILAFANKEAEQGAAANP